MEHMSMFGRVHRADTFSMMGRYLGWGDGPFTPEQTAELKKLAAESLRRIREGFKPASRVVNITTPPEN